MPTRPTPQPTNASGPTSAPKGQSDDDVRRVALQLNREALAMGKAILTGDILEARFRSHLIMGRSASEGLPFVAQRAAELHRLLCIDDTRLHPKTSATISALAAALTAAVSK